MFPEPNTFTARDGNGRDKWEEWTPVYSFTTATSLTVTGRFRIVGRQCFFQAKSSGTSLATTAGTDYIALPLIATGFGGTGMMSNDTANTAVGVGHIDVTDSRFYPPSQVASGNTFTFSGWFEV